MVRYIVFKEIEGVKSQHGTLLYLENDGVAITSHPIDGLNISYFVSHSGLERDAVRVVPKEEIAVLAPGLAAASISPYIYRIELAERLYIA